MLRQPTEEPGVVIVGAGHAGGRAAERLRAFGYTKPISLVGQESHRPYERPPLSKSVLTSPAHCEAPQLMPLDTWNALNIRFFAETVARSIDRRKRTVTLSTGKLLSYEKLILATGLVPRQLPQLSLSETGIFSVNQFDDSLLLRDRLSSADKILIVGAGFIGLEVASSARKLGIEVNVVEMAKRPLQRILTEEMSDWMINWHHANGVNIHCGRQIAERHLSNGQHHVTLDDGTALEADLIVIGVGGTPRIDLAAEAGLEIVDGVIIDGSCRSSDPDIYAIGDIACLADHQGHGPRRLESWKNAEDSAATAARNICGDNADYNEVPWFWTDQFGCNLQLTGDMPHDADIYERGQIGDAGYLAYFALGDALLGAFGIDCGGDIRRARAHIEKSKPLTAKGLDKSGLQPRDSNPAPAVQEFVQ